MNLLPVCITFLSIGHQGVVEAWDNPDSFVPDASSLPGHFSLRHLTKDGECPQGLIECEGGNVKGDTGTTCKAACDGACCTDPVDDSNDPCNGFWGSVCPDNGSCIGRTACAGAYIGRIVQGCEGAQACYGAVIDEVVDGCKGGEKACYKAGEMGGTVRKVHEGCMGLYSCREIAYLSGEIDLIEDGCHGERACSHAAQYVGEINLIEDACHGERACFYAAERRGKIDEIVDSCKCRTDEDEDCAACMYAGSGGAEIKGIQDSCKNVRACEGAGRVPGHPIIPTIEDCCHEEEECTDHELVVNFSDHC